MNRIIRTSLITNIHSFSFIHFAVKYHNYLLLISPVVYGGTTGKFPVKVVDKETNEPIVGANIVIEGTY